MVNSFVWFYFILVQAKLVSTMLQEPHTGTKGEEESSELRWLFKRFHILAVSMLYF